MPGSHLLAIASRWFDERTVATVFEPLVADWQRQWLEAPQSRRASIAVRGFAAFACAVAISAPRIALTPSPEGLTTQIIRRTTAFTATATVVLMLPVIHEVTSGPMNRTSSIRGSLLLLAMLGATTMTFPFAMTGGADVIRRRNALPHVGRAALVKLAACALLFTLAYSGWVVPALTQAARREMNPQGMDAPLLQVQDLTTPQLLLDPDRATVFAGDTYSASRSATIQHELNKRMVLAVLPLALLWLRWRAFTPPRSRWIKPLPWVASTLIAFTAFLSLWFFGFQIEHTFELAPGTGCWIPLAVFALWAGVTNYCRPLLLARV